METYFEKMRENGSDHTATLTFPERSSCYVGGLALGVHGIYGKEVADMRGEYQCRYELENGTNKLLSLALTRDERFLYETQREGKIILCKDLCVGFFAFNPEMSYEWHDKLVDAILKASRITQARREAAAAGQTLPQAVEQHYANELTVLQNTFPSLPRELSAPFLFSSASIFKDFPGRPPITPSDFPCFWCFTDSTDEYALSVVYDPDEEEAYRKHPTEENRPTVCYLRLDIM